MCGISGKEIIKEWHLGKPSIIMLHSITYTEVKSQSRGRLTYRKITGGLGNVVLGLLDCLRVFCIAEGINGVFLFLSEEYFMKEKEGFGTSAFSELVSTMHFNSHCISLTVMHYLCE